MPTVWTDGGGGSGGFQRWTPSHASAVGEPVAAATPRGDDIIVPKLGTGPQRHKYTVEQMLSIYATWCERAALGTPKGLDVGSLLDADTPHHLLELLEAIAQQAVRFSQPHAPDTCHVCMSSGLLCMRSVFSSIHPCSWHNLCSFAGHRPVSLGQGVDVFWLARRASQLKKAAPASLGGAQIELASKHRGSGESCLWIDEALTIELWHSG